MTLNPIILALVFAFLARGAGGEDGNNNGTDSGKNPTLITSSNKKNTSTTNKGNDSKENTAKNCKLYVKKCKECSGKSPKRKFISPKPSYPRNGGTATTDGTEKAFPVAQPTKLTMTVNFTGQWDRPVQPDTSGTMHSNNNHNCNCNHSCHHYNHGNLALWVALAIVTVLLVGHVVYHWHTLIRRPRWNQVPNNDADVVNSDVGFHSLAMRPASTNISQEQLNEGITLEQLEHENLVEFEWMCMRLDNGQGRDYERLAAKYPRISLDQRQSLQHEFQNRGGSPSKALMKHLQVLYPYLTLGDLLRSLAEIGRVDIVRRLKQRVKKNTCSTVS